ncbi:MAG: hypothetical protein LBB90_07985 [Tannerella sp.]|jgi:hypothetical protein|nr:hypothetical protein [Tannerella sp.]
MKRILLFGLFLAAVFPSCKKSSVWTDEMLKEYNRYNLTVGTQTIGAIYKFTEKPILVETAERIIAMGSNILKISLNPAWQENAYNTETPEIFRHAPPSVIASQEPAVKAMLDMDFSYILLWTATPEVDWTDGMSEKELEMEYQAIWDLAEYFRIRFKGTGKKFYIGHREGDWLLLGSFSFTQERIDTVRIQGMIDWYNIRQKAVDDAVNATVSDTEVFQYPELKNTLFNTLDYIEKNMKAKERLKGKRVFIGEYGFPQYDYPEKQAYCSLNVMKAGIEWGCPFILYREMYDNEGRSYWMIDKNNVEQPVYKAHQTFYEEMKKYVREYIDAERHIPDNAEFRNWEVQVLSELRFI